MAGGEQQGDSARRAAAAATEASRGLPAREGGIAGSAARLGIEFLLNPEESTAVGADVDRSGDEGDRHHSHDEDEAQARATSAAPPSTKRTAGHDHQRRRHRRTKRSTSWPEQGEEASVARGRSLPSGGLLQREEGRTSPWFPPTTTAARRYLNEKLRQRIGEKRRPSSPGEAGAAGGDGRPPAPAHDGEDVGCGRGIVATREELKMLEGLMLSFVIQPFLPSRASPSTTGTTKRTTTTQPSLPTTHRGSLSSSFQFLSRSAIAQHDLESHSPPSGGLARRSSSSSPPTHLRQHERSPPSLHHMLLHHRRHNHHHPSPQVLSCGDHFRSHEERRKRRRKNESDDAQAMGFVGGGLDTSGQDAHPLLADVLPSPSDTLRGWGGQPACTSRSPHFPPSLRW